MLPKNDPCFRFNPKPQFLITTYVPVKIITQTEALFRRVSIICLHFFNFLFKLSKCYQKISFYLNKTYPNADTTVMPF